MTLTQLTKAISSTDLPRQHLAVVELFKQCGRYASMRHSSYADLKRAPWPKGGGVYIVRQDTKEEAGKVIYIGKTGKLCGKDGQNVSMNGGEFSKRILRTTPYCYQGSGTYADYFEYGPNFKGVKPAIIGDSSKRYRFHIPLANITTECLSIAGIEREICPAPLEALLLQIYIAQYSALPPANQEL